MHIDVTKHMAFFISMIHSKKMHIFQQNHPLLFSFDHVFKQPIPVVYIKKYTLIDHNPKIPERFWDSGKISGFQKDSTDFGKIPVFQKDSRDSEKIPEFQKNSRDSGRIP